MEINLEHRLRKIFDENSPNEARNKIGSFVTTLDKKSQRELNAICSKIFEEKARGQSGVEAQENYLCAIRCALANEDRERAYQILDNEDANQLMRSYANEGIGSPSIQHPIDVVIDFFTSRNPECKVINDLLVDYFTDRDKKLEDYRVLNTHSCADNKLLDIRIPLKNVD